MCLSKGTQRVREDPFKMMESGSDCTQLTFRRMRGESAKIKHGRMDTESAVVSYDDDESNATIIVGEEIRARLSNNRLKVPVSIFGHHHIRSNGYVTSAETSIKHGSTDPVHENISR